MSRLIRPNTSLELFNLEKNQENTFILGFKNINYCRSKWCHRLTISTEKTVRLDWILRIIDPTPGRNFSSWEV